MNTVFPELIEPAANDYMATHTEYVEYVQPLLNMDQMAALLYCAQDYFWEDAYDKIPKDERPERKLLLKRDVGTETIFLVLSLLTPGHDMKYNWFPSLMCYHRAHVEKFLVTQHYFYQDGEVDEKQNFTETVPCRGFELRPYREITSIILGRIFGSAIVNYGPALEPKPSPQLRIPMQKADRTLLNDAKQWCADCPLSELPYREYSVFPSEDFLEADDFIASYLGEDTLHILGILHTYTNQRERKTREFVFNLPHIWLKWLTTKKNTQDMLDVKVDEGMRMRMTSRAAKRIRDEKEKE